MPIKTLCPACNATLQISKDKLGKKVRCSKCKVVFAAEEKFDHVEVVDEVGEPEDRSGTQSPQRAEPAKERKRRKKLRAAVERMLGRHAVAYLILAYVGTFINFVVFMFAAVYGFNHLWNRPQPKTDRPRVYNRYVIEDPRGQACLLVFYCGLAVVGYYRLMTMFADNVQRRVEFRAAVFHAALITAPCCCTTWIITFPVGVWMLLGLFREGVRQSFEIQ